MVGAATGRVVATLKAAIRDVGTFGQLGPDTEAGISRGTGGRC